MTNESKDDGASALLYRAFYQILGEHSEGYSEAKAASINTVGDLREALGALFKAQSGPFPEPEYFKPLDYPRQRVDYRVSDEVLAELLRRTEATFVSLAQTEPHWAVITNDRFLADRIEDSKEQFYETGQHNIAQLNWFLERHEINTADLHTCFELGSGVGRVTLWLARTFARVIASDVSGRMLELANEYLSAQGLYNVGYVTLNNFRLFDDLEPFDLFYSSIVLQHNTPPVQRYMLSKILAKLNPRGVALFQVIGGVKYYNFDANAYLADAADGPRIEMHPFIHEELFAVAAEQDCRVLELREDGACGPVKEMISNIVMLQKAS